MESLIFDLALATTSPVSGLYTSKETELAGLQFYTGVHDPDREGEELVALDAAGVADHAAGGPADFRPPLVGLAVAVGGERGRRFPGRRCGPNWTGRGAGSRSDARNRGPPPRPQACRWPRAWSGTRLSSSP